MRLRTVLRYGAQRDPELQTMADYVALPAIELYGTWNIKDVVPPEQLAALAAWANRYEANRSRTLGMVFKTVTAPAELFSHAAG